VAAENVFSQYCFVTVGKSFVAAEFFVSKEKGDLSKN